MNKLSLTSTNLVFLALCLTISTLGMQQAWANDESTDKAADVKPIRFGFFPIISTVALYKRFSPLRDYLAKELHRPVDMQTAKDFPTFLQRTDQGQYDIVVTAPHFAVRAVDSGKYRIVASLLGNVRQLVIVREDSPIKNIDQLAGKVIATPPADALMTMVGMRELRKAGLTGKRAPTYRGYTSHNAANEALLGREVAAAIGSSNVIKKAMGKGAPFRIIARSKKMPNMATMVATKLDQKLVDQLVKVLVGMKNDDKGRKVLKLIRFPGYRVVENSKEYEPMREFMQQAVKALKLKNHKD